MSENNLLDLQFLIVPGKDLVSADLDIINMSRQQEFGSKSLIQPAPDNEEWNKLYFLVKDTSQQLLSFGRLHDVTITFQQHDYSILGIATVVSVIKGKGYGKFLMQGIKNYVHSTRKTAIGFCNPSNTSFYEKCCYDIFVDRVTKFAYKDPEGNLIFDERPGDVLYLNGDNTLIELVKNNPAETAYMSRKHW